jgi:hypothetical protein
MSQGSFPVTSAADDVRTWREELARARANLEQARSAILQLRDLLAAKVESDRRSAATTRLHVASWCGGPVRQVAAATRLAVFRLRHVESSTARGSAAAGIGLSSSGCGTWLPSAASSTASGGAAAGYSSLFPGTATCIDIACSTTRDT